MTDLQTAAKALLTHWDSLQTADLADAEESVDALRQALAEQSVKQATKSLAQEVIGCFDAAEVEGLQFALAKTTDERLRDLVVCHLEYARYAAEKALSQALQEPDTGIDRGAWSDVPSATKWVDELRGGDEKSENTQAQELSGNTEQLEAEIKRLQELADYRLKLLTKMPSEWVGLTDEDIEELRRNGAHSVSDADFQAIEAKLKELNHA